MAKKNRTPLIELKDSPPPKKHKRRSGGIFIFGWKTCRHCDAEIAKSAKHCPYCGAWVNGRQLVSTIIGIILLLIVLMLVLPSEGQIRVPVNVTVKGTYSITP